MRALELLVADGLRWKAQRALADIKQGRGGDDDIGAGLVLRKGGEREDERCPRNADAREQPHRDRALRLRAPVHHRAVQRSGTGAMSVKVATSPNTVAASGDASAASSAAPSLNSSTATAA